MIARQLFAKISVHHRIAELFILALFGITLLLTYSRAAFLGLLAGVLVLCIICSTWRLRLLGGLLIVCVITLALLIPQVQQRLLSIGDSHTATDRAVIWSQGIQVIADHPFGVGFGNYSKIIGRYYDNINANITVRTYPHHIVLAVWAETGPIGLISFLFAWASLLHACLRRLKQHHATNHTTAAAGCMLIVAYYTVGLTHDILYHNAVALAFSAAMGAVLARLDES